MWAVTDLGGPNPAWTYIPPRMSLSVVLLGTSASRPTVERNVSSLALVREGETMLFDCGEGTQRQMMRYGVSFALSDIFFTHFHADHVIGVIGLMRTMALQGRADPLRLWGPRGASRHLKSAVQFGVDRLTFEVAITDLDDGGVVERKDYAVRAFAVEHGPGPALGYSLVEATRKGRFDPDRARELGIPEGPLWGRIHRGESVTLDSGQTISPSELVGEPRPGRTVVVTGDTRPCERTVEAAHEADLLVHEATFGDEEAERAVETGHSTAREAAIVARRAGCRRLLLSHFSARYSRDAAELEAQARSEFPNVTIGKDGMEVDIPFADRD